MIFYLEHETEFANFDVTAWKSRPFENIPIPQTTTISKLCDASGDLCAQLCGVSLPILTLMDGDDGETFTVNLL